MAGIPAVQGASARVGFLDLHLNVGVNAGLMLWARREWRRRWVALAVLAVLVAVGGGASLAAGAAARRTETAFNRMLEMTRQPNLTVIGAGNGFTDLDPSLLDQVMRIDGVRGATEFAFLAVAPKGFANFFALAVIGQRGETMNPIALEGKTINDMNALGAEEVVLNEAMRAQLGVGVGDMVTLTTLTQAQFETSLSQDTGMVPAGPSVIGRIAGVSRGPEDVSDAPDPFLLLPPAFYSKYHESIGACRCDVVINADPGAIDAVTAQLGVIYPDASVGRADDLGSRITDTVSLQKRAWWVIALAAALSGAIALLQASARMGHMLSGDDGARSALGMTRRQRRFGPFLVMAPSMVMGSAAAIGVAYALSPLAPVGLTRLAEPSPGLRWETGVLVPGVFVLLIVSLLVAWVAAVVPRRVRRGGSAVRVGGPKVALGNRLAFGPGRGAIVGILLSTAGLVGGMTLEHSIDHVLSTPALYGADFDAANFLDSGADKRALGQQLAPDPDVEAVGLVVAKLPSASLLHIVGRGGEADVSPDAFEAIKGTLSIHVTRGRPPARDDEVVIGQALLDQLGADIGDRVTANGSKGTAQLTVVGDDLDPGVDVAGHGFGLTVGGLTALVEPSIQGTVVRFAPGADQHALLERYAALDLTPVTPPSEILHIGQLGGLPGRVGQLFTLLGLAALVNAVVLTLRTGRREVALHRALGFTSGQVFDAHLWQGAVTAVIGVVIGSSVGLIVGRAIDRHLITSVGGIAEIVLPAVVWSAIAGIVAVCLFAFAITGILAVRCRSGIELRVE